MMLFRFIFELERIQKSARIDYLCIMQLYDGFVVADKIGEAFYLLVGE